MTVLNALSQPLPTLTSSQVLKEPNPWRCPVPPSVPARPSGDQELLDELCGSGEDSQLAKAAFHSQWQQEGRSTRAACSGV